MRERRRGKLTDLMRIEGDRVLAVTASGDRYLVVCDHDGSAEPITIQQAALLWQQGQCKQWERLDPTVSPAQEEAKSFREQLREKLGYTEDP